VLDIAAVNWLAVLVAGVASFVLGGLWYSLLFNKPWMRYTGITMEAASAGGGANMAAQYAGAFLTYLVAAAALALVMNTAGATGAGEGLVIGVLVGIGFVATTSFNIYLFSMRPFGLYLIDIGYPVVALGMSGVILGLWQ
jgi:hypothetical protein